MRSRDELRRLPEMAPEIAPETGSGGQSPRTPQPQNRQPPEPTFGRAVLTIDLGAVAANFRLVSGKLQGARCGAVVKADGYSLGLAPIARTLAATGCSDFFVADVNEGIALREVVGEVVGEAASGPRIFVLNGPPADAVAEIQRHRLIPVLNDLGQIALWAERGRGAETAIHVDTGISRLGLPPSEVAVLAREPGRLANIHLALVMSHLACADDPNHPLNNQQLEAFVAARKQLPAAPASLANSAGVFLGRQFHFDVVRPGGALYGLAPFASTANPTAPVVKLEAPILQVRDVDSPTTVGYGASYRVARRGRLATIPLGYADGFMRSLSNRGSAFLGGLRIPLVGRVSMDSATFDVTDVPSGIAVPGAMVEIIGPRHSIEDLAREAGTIGHEILTALGHRYARRYLPAPPAGAMTGETHP